MLQKNQRNKIKIMLTDEDITYALGVGNVGVPKIYTGDPFCLKRYELEIIGKKYRKLIKTILTGMHNSNELNR